MKFAVVLIIVIADCLYAESRSDLSIAKENEKLQFIGRHRNKGIFSYRTPSRGQPQICYPESSEPDYDPCSSSVSTWNNMMVGDDLDDDVGGDFCRVRLLSPSLFVDQSLLINEFLKSDVKVPTIRRPVGGWGKTVNIDMLRRFFQLEVSEYGEPLIEDHSFNRKLFAGGKIRVDTWHTTVNLKPLNVIAAMGDEAALHLGRYPVVYLSFKNIVGRTYDEIEDRARKAISHLYSKRYGYLMRELTNDMDRDRFERYVDNRNITAEELRDSLRFLCEKLYEHFGKSRRVMVFLDDYDTPLHRLYLQLNGGVESIDIRVEGNRQLEQLLDLTGNLLDRCLRNCDLVERGLIVGSSMNNLPFLSPTDKRLSQFFGFTKQTIEWLVADGGNRYYTPDIKDWYCGYNFGLDRELCHPSFVIRVLSGSEDDEFECANPTPILDRELLSTWFQPILQRLAAGANVTHIVTHAADFANICKEDRLISVLIFYGYLSPVGTKEEYCILRAGNEQLNIFYLTKLSQLLEMRLSSLSPLGPSTGGIPIGQDRRGKMANFLLSNRVRLFEALLNQTIAATTNNTQICDGDNLPDFYQLILSSFLQSRLCNIVHITPKMVYLISENVWKDMRRILATPVTSAQVGQNYNAAIMIGIHIVSTSNSKMGKEIVDKFLEHDEGEKYLMDHMGYSCPFTNIIKICVTFENFTASVR